MTWPVVAVIATAVVLTALGCLFGSYLIPAPKEDGPLGKHLIEASGLLAVAGLFLSAALVAHGWGLIT